VNTDYEEVRHKHAFCFTNIPSPGKKTFVCCQGRLGYEFASLFVQCEEITRIKDMRLK